MFVIKDDPESKKTLSGPYHIYVRELYVGHINDLSFPVFIGDEPLSYCAMLI